MLYIQNLFEHPVDVVFQNKFKLRTLKFEFWFMITKYPSDYGDFFFNFDYQPTGDCLVWWWQQHMHELVVVVVPVLHLLSFGLPLMLEKQEA